MSTADRQESAPAPADVAARLRGQGLVSLVATPDGDALAATGLLGRALAGADVPFQARVARVPDLGTTDADCTVGVGHDCGDVTLAGTGPVSATAFDVARELGDDPDPVLALAGTTAAGRVPGQTDGGAFEAATERGLLTRRPGVTLPTDDVADGLAHTTLFHAPFSGDVEAARTSVARRDVGSEPDDDGRRRLASLVALSVVERAPPRAAESVERALHPYTLEGPFETVGGYADVLEAVVRERPGAGLAFALGHGGRTAALDAWRAHGTATHRALRDAGVARHRGCVVARVSADGGDDPRAEGDADGSDAVGDADGTDVGVAVETVARLLRDYRSPEPVVVVVAGNVAGVATVDRDAAALVREAATATGGTGSGRASLGYAEGVDGDAFVEHVREVVA
jgi:hypothetical protein